MGRDVHADVTRRLLGLRQARLQASRARFLRASRRESLGSLLLGTLTATLGLLMLTAAVAGLAGQADARWNVPVTILMDQRPRQYVVETSPWTGRRVRVAVQVPVARYHGPSEPSVGLALAGLLPCLAGFSRRRVSPLAAFSALMLLASFAVPFGWILAVQGCYWLVDLLF